jgi:hypothetical protein
MADFFNDMPLWLAVGVGGGWWCTARTAFTGDALVDGCSVVLPTKARGESPSSSTTLDVEDEEVSNTMMTQ